MVGRKEPLIDSSRFSSWKRLICTMARVLRFIVKCRNHIRQGGGRDLTTPEIDRGEIATLRVAQMEDFADDLNRLQQKQDLSPSSRISVNSLLSYKGRAHRTRKSDKRIRQKYWITKIRSSVRAVWHACAICKVRKAQPI